ncbi:HU family DNA-binding protein [Psychromonas sp. SP041]|uniref:HU family DNA-binding protein n=1 Tax=Psychromonas sp. SP041 TaxID=1365007 RepID=UPI0010C7B38E|nr:HU family DNA-binding protein [Psychromonas sp. SP041]
MAQFISRKVPSKELINLTKKNLVLRVEQEADIENGQASSLVEALLSAITDFVVEKKTVMLTKIGGLTVSYKVGRPGRNLKTLESTEITPRYSVTLRTGSGKSNTNERVGQPNIIKHTIDKLPNVHPKLVKVALDQLLAMLEMVKEGTYRVEIRNFGVFYPSILPEGRKARNPKTGQSVIAKRKVVIRYKCPESIKKSLNP